MPMNSRSVFSMAIAAVLILCCGSTILVAQESSAIQTGSENVAGWDLWSQGQVEAAETFARDALGKDPNDSSARHLLVQLLILDGQYEKGLEHYAQLDPDYSQIRALDRFVLEAHKNLGRFDRAVTFAEKAGKPDWLIVPLKSQRDRPLRLSLSQTTVVPFSQTQPRPGMIPAVSITINGQDYLGHLDTGGAYVSMSPKMAEKFGITTTPYGEGFANGQPTTVEVGTVESLRIGGALLENVPMKAVASLKGGQGKFRIEELVILGTNILGQFLTTWDNQKQRLILSPRQDPISRREHFRTYVSPDAQTMKFYMVPDHYLIAHGAIDDRNAVYFVDTGLVTRDAEGRQPGVMLPANNTAKYAVEGEYSEITFIDAPGPVRLGGVEIDQQRIQVRPGRVFNFAGIKTDAMLAHGFLKHCVWTIDFDTRSWYLHRFSEKAVATTGRSIPR